MLIEGIFYIGFDTQYLMLIYLIFSILNLLMSCQTASAHAIREGGLQGRACPSCVVLWSWLTLHICGVPFISLYACLVILGNVLHCLLVVLVFSFSVSLSLWAESLDR